MKDAGEIAHTQRRRNKLVSCHVISNDLRQRGPHPDMTLESVAPKGQLQGSKETLRSITERKAIVFRFLHI